MRASLRSVRSAALGMLILASLTLTACPAKPRPAPAPTTASKEEPVQRLALDPALSPIPFRWLNEDCVLIAPDVSARKLASFGNYLARSAKKRDRVRLAVWDDEAAWKLDHERDDDEDEKALTHKRALFAKNVLGSPPVEQYATFGKNGDVTYERDFRTYPISSFDDE